MNNKIRIASVDMAMDTNLMAVMPSGTLETEFFFYAIEKEGLFRIADTSTIPQLNNKHINPYKLRIPPLLEQCRIAEILRTWDEAIDKASQLCTAKGAQYRAIRRSITSVSSNGHSGKDLLRLSEITKRVRRVNDGQDHPVMTISAKSGFILQSDKYSRDMAGTSLENYIVLHRGEFAYNKGNSLTSPQGCIFRLGEEKALVPHVYFCFSLKKCLDEDFFVHLVESGYLNHQLSRVINSGVRNDGLLNLNAPDFFNCRVPVPPVEEQARIADILNGLRSELAILDKQVELLERQKRGLMQKLLTGEWRVTV
jgi:type I restriction enzyme S subunit